MSLKYGQSKSYYQLCRRKNLIALDYWSDNESPGCLSNYNNQNDFYSKWNTLSGGQKNSLWSFYDLMNIGDIVFIRDIIDNKPTICAMCIVKSDYKYNEFLLYNEDEWDKEYYSWGHYRDVEYLQFSTIELSTGGYRSTLHKITNQPILGIILTSNEKELDLIKSIVEGARSYGTYSKIERNPKNRESAIKLQGQTCKVCGFNFKDTYGDIGDGFIEVHHIEQLSKTGETLVDPEKDLVVLCSNCHRMLHRSKDSNLTWQDLKEKIKKGRQ